MLGNLLMLRGAQLFQTLATGSKASQFFRPFCPQGSEPPTTYNLLLREQTPKRQNRRLEAVKKSDHYIQLDTTP